MVQRISPVLIYDDGDTAIRFLTEAFGFTEHGVYRTPEGAIAHAELTYDGGFVGLSERAGGERSIFDTGPCTIYVVVDDQDFPPRPCRRGGRRRLLPPDRPGLRLSRFYRGPGRRGVHLVLRHLRTRLDPSPP